MFAYPALGDADPLASYRAAQASRIQAAQPVPQPGMPITNLPPVQILAPPAPTPKWVVYGGAILGLTVLGLAAYAIFGKKGR